MEAAATLSCGSEEDRARAPVQMPTSLLCCAFPTLRLVLRRHSWVCQPPLSLRRLFLSIYLIEEGCRYMWVALLDAKGTLAVSLAITRSLSFLSGRLTP